MRISGVKFQDKQLWAGWKTAFNRDQRPKCYQQRWEQQQVWYMYISYPKQQPKGQQQQRCTLHQQWNGRGSSSRGSSTWTAYVASSSSGSSQQGQHKKRQQIDADRRPTAAGAAEVTVINYSSEWCAIQIFRIRVNGAGRVKSINLKTTCHCVAWSCRYALYFLAYQSSNTETEMKEGVCVVQVRFTGLLQGSLKWIMCGCAGGSGLSNEKTCVMFIPDIYVKCQIPQTATVLMNNAENIYSDLHAKPIHAEDARRRRLARLVTSSATAILDRRRRRGSAAYSCGLHTFGSHNPEDLGLNPWTGKVNQTFHLSWVDKLAAIEYCGKVDNYLRIRARCVHESTWLYQRKAMSGLKIKMRA